MIFSGIVYRLAPAVATCILLVEGVPLPAQDVELAESVRVALARYAALDPLSVTWTQSAEATSAGQETFAAEVLPKKIAGDSFVQQLVFRESRIYVRRETQVSSSWPPRTEEVAFDGNLFYAGNNLFYAGQPRSREPRDQPFLHKWLPANDRPEASFFRDDYFRAAGIRIASQMKELTTSWHPQSELLTLLAEGGRIEATGPASLDGRPMLRASVSPGKPDDTGSPRRRYDFYFDPERRYAVRRLDTRDAAGRLLVRSDCTDFELLSSRSIWMPRQCRVEEHARAARPDEPAATYTNYGSPLYVIDIRVIAFEVKPWSDERFRLRDPPAGGFVNDASFPETTGTEGILYQVPVNPQRLDEVIATRRALYQGCTSAERKSPRLRTLLAVLNGLGLVSLVVYFFVRRRKEARRR